MTSRGGGRQLYRKLDYHPRKKINVIRVVFQDQAMYARTSFRSAKRAKLGKGFANRVCFGHIDKFWKGHDAQIKKNACKNAYFNIGSIFIVLKNICLGCVLKVLLRG